MERDFDLIRAIFKEIEAKPAGVAYTNIRAFEDYDPAAVYAHFDLLIDAGFLKGRVVRVMKGISGIHIDELTWAGYEFLHAAADDSLWRKAKETILKPGVSVTFDLLLEWLKAQLRLPLGLP
ncbi:MAG: hypothetical protein A4E60_00991 [Syntrophorhabdus sp. PtaB.Bin047]|jgi:hypothetical protein|nr:MAG: hypothetical protein A4E60_00991 [Syntrophorhabdus sp. PtaB.Bin047]